MERSETRMRIKNTNLQPADRFLSRQLELDRATGAQRHRDKLPDDTRAHVDPVNPNLVRTDDVVLRCRANVAVPKLSGDNIDAAAADLHCTADSTLVSNPSHSASR